MSDMNDQPLSQLALSLMDDDTRAAVTGRTPGDVVVDREVFTHDHHHHAHGCATGYGWASFVFFFLIAAIVFFFLYWCLKPSFVLKNNCHSRSSSESSENWEHEIDNNKLLGAAIVSSLVLIFVLWLIWLAYSW